MSESRTPMTDALHQKLVRISEGADWIAGKDYCDMFDHARRLELALAQAESELRDAQQWVAALAKGQGGAAYEIMMESPRMRRYSTTLATIKELRDGK